MKKEDISINLIKELNKLIKETKIDEIEQLTNISKEINDKVLKEEITTNKENSNINNNKNPFEQNGFIKIQKNKKIIIKTYHNNNIINSYEYKFETNSINTIPETDIKFTICLEKDNDEYLDFFTNLFNPNLTIYNSPTTTFFPGITNNYHFYRYMFNYKEENKLKIGIDESSYLEVSVE